MTDIQAELLALFQRDDLERLETAQRHLHQAHQALSRIHGATTDPNLRAAIEAVQVGWQETVKYEATLAD